MRAWGATAAAVLVAGITPAAWAGSAPDAGRAWSPPPAPPKRYAVGAPVQHRVVASDGASLFVETWLPAAKDGRVPPERVPTIATISPYLAAGRMEPAGAPEMFVTRGYAYSQIHVRGTGESTGCYLVQSAQDADDSARAIEFVGEHAPWSDGTVGLYSKSNPGGAQLNVAGRGPRERLRSLRAIVPASPVTNHTDWRTFDGVPIVGSELVYTWALVDLAASLGAHSDDPATPDQIAQRASCQAGYGANAANTSGVQTAWDHERDLRRFAPDIAVPVLFTNGLYENQSRMLLGTFDRIGAARSPRPKRVALLGQWRHDFPDHNAWEPDWSRSDWEATVLAWYERWLRGVRNGVDDWPTVQVQDTTGQWRTEPDYPRTGGPAGQLAVGPGGRLGVPRPTGSSALDSLTGSGRTVEGQTGTAPPGTELTWTTDELSAPVRVTGQAILDLWIVLAQPRGRLVAALEAVGPDGALVPRSRRIGARSLQHLDPWTDDRFVQTRETPPPTGRPLRVQLRFEPADLVAPRGGRLVLRLGTAGVAENGLGDPTYELPGIPDPAAGTITVLHDCEHPTALRFLRPRPIPDRIDVAETDQDKAALGAGGRVTAPVDPGMPLAAGAVCGRGPERLAVFGPESDYPAVTKKRRAKAKRKVGKKRRKAVRKPRGRRR